MNELISLRKQLMKETKRQVREDISQSDLPIVRSVNALTDLDATANLLAENVREWYQSEFPELERLVSNQETVIELIANVGSKKNFMHASASNIISDPELVEKIRKQAQDSAGTDLEESTLQHIQNMAKQVLELRAERRKIQGFIETQVQHKTPNFGQLAGLLLAARMIAKAGSVEKLATLPASALQVQGAEKALFAHLKDKRRVRPPKHGFVFNHPLVQKIHPQKRGAMARTLAGKLAIALKMDVNGSNPHMWKTLSQQLEKRFEQLQKKPSDSRKKSFSKPRYESSPRQFGETKPAPHKGKFAPMVALNDTNQTAPSYAPRNERSFAPRGDRPFKPRGDKPFGKREFSGSSRSDGPRESFGRRPRSDGPRPFVKGRAAERRYGNKPGNFKKRGGDRPFRPFPENTGEKPIPLSSFSSKPSLEQFSTPVPVHEPKKNFGHKSSGRSFKGKKFGFKKKKRF